ECMVREDQLRQIDLVEKRVHLRYLHRINMLVVRTRPKSKIDRKRHDKRQDRKRRSVAHSVHPRSAIAAFVQFFGQLFFSASLRTVSVDGPGGSSYSAAKP